MKTKIVIVALAVCVLGASRPARAQIYSWNDPNGIMVVSNVPRGATGQRTLTAAPAILARVAGPSLRNSSYDSIIQQHSLLQGIRTDLVRAVIQVESAFNPKAVSPKGAKGLMQLMPQTAARYGVLDAFNPAENIRAGVSYLKQLLIRYENNEQLALAAYNAGPLAVDRHGSTVPPYKETQAYVQRIKALGGATTPGTPGLKIYKWVEVVDGVEVVRYSNVKPANTTYQEVRR